ncbi:hypothetical protein GCM10007421_23090 [Halopseudomonas oceani]|jgi:hypothetical protein|uniref:DNA polymerase III subunit chi n=2 Tax=Halopseudomonas oceani TaxID=1708783 RepID=A0A2P4ET79_9GAMM|nr:hypothetical protein C1949_13665 [Halopseudomonas oceani]GGE48220.1 hypothetical protein GCM10007421_23090 [Halopseudomonas oceani]
MMKQRDPSEPSRLLEDLESIRTLLDEHPEAPSGDQTADGQLDIPLLQDVIINPNEAPLSALDSTEQPTPQAPLSKSHNPFLPYASLARLAEERMQLDQLLTQPTPSQPVPATSSAREMRLEARLQSEAQLLLQEVIDDLIPTIEAELRKRMQGRLQQIIREQLK